MTLSSNQMDGNNILQSHYDEGPWLQVQHKGKTRQIFPQQHRTYETQEQRTNKLFQERAAAYDNRANLRVKKLEKQCEMKSEASKEKIAPALTSLSGKEEFIENTKQEKEIFDEEITFSPISLSVIYDNKKFVSFEEHGIPYGKDFTPLYLRQEHEIIGAEHVKMRLELFHKLCQFVQKNKQIFEKNKLTKDMVINQFKAQFSYIPKKSESYFRSKCFEEAHISFFPNLACSTSNKMVNGGKIDLNGVSVNLEQMLNLTNRVPKKINDIDAVSEVYVRYLGLCLLSDISEDKITAEEAITIFANKYSKCMRTLEIKTGLVKAQTKNSKKKFHDSEKEILNNEYYSHQFFYNTLGTDEITQHFVKGMHDGIARWKEEHFQLNKEAKTQEAHQVQRPSSYTST